MYDTRVFSVCPGSLVVYMASYNGSGAHPVIPSNWLILGQDFCLQFLNMPLQILSSAVTSWDIHVGNLLTTSCLVYISLVAISFCSCWFRRTLAQPSALRSSIRICTGTS